MSTIPISVNAACRDGEGDLWIQVDEGGNWHCVTADVDPEASAGAIELNFGSTEPVTLVGPATEFAPDPEPRSGDVMEFGTAEIISGGSQ